MLVGSRRTEPDERHLGEYRVDFSFSPPEGHTAVAAQTDLSYRLAPEIAAMQKRLDSLHQALSRSVVTTPRWLAPTTALADVLAALIEADLDGQLAQDIVDRVHSSLPSGHSGPVSVMEIARREIQGRVSTDSGVGKAGSSQKIAAFVGPPGAGKTTTIVKLAVRSGIAARRSVHLISTDAIRVGGADQLRSFAAILGVTFQLADTPAALSQAIDEHRAKDLILIDTPGLTAQDSEHAALLATVLARRSDIDTHLVLQCTTRTADLSRVAQTFSCFAPSKVAFTRLDETEAYGGILTTAHRLQLPLSFLCAGQRIPEHLEAATPERIANLILNPDSCAARAAA